jgi:hypothetical protein
MGGAKDLRHAAYEAVGATQLTQVLGRSVDDARGRRGPAEHRRTLPVGRSEVRYESGDGEGAAWRGGDDGQELTSDGSLEEFGIEGVTREIRGGTTPLAGIVVDQLYREAKSA